MLALMLALVLVLELLIPIRDQLGAEASSGTEGEMPIWFSISLELDLTVARMGESQLDGIEPAQHLWALGETSELGFVLC